MQAELSAAPRHGAKPAKPADPHARVHIVRNGFLYAGAMWKRPVTQRNSVIVCVALTSEKFSVQTPKKSLSKAEAALMSPGTMHIHSAKSPVALLDICPTDYNFRAFVTAVSGVKAWPRAHFAALLPAFESFMDGTMHRTEAGELWKRFRETALQLVPPVKPLDARVREVMRLLREEPGLSTSQLASAVDMSADWLRHLFATEAGIPLRRYEMTLRLQTAAAHLTRGISLTQVAENSGFSDLAHFSRFWKVHYGYPPRHAFFGDELSIDAVSGACLDVTPPSAETQLVPGPGGQRP